MDPYAIGQKFEQSLLLSKRKSEGIFYTPQSITAYICKQTISRWIDDNQGKQSNTPTKKIKVAHNQDLEKKLQNIRIIDLACGAGAFLQQACRELVDIRQSKGINSQKIDITQIRKEITCRNLYGIDLDEDSIGITKQVLIQELFSPTSRVFPLDLGQIKCRNSLVCDKTIVGDKAIDFDLDQKFDIILGNPPYINASMMKNKFPKEREFIRQTFQYLQERWDIYLAFIEQALNLVAPNGYIGYIIPETFLTEKYAAKMRKVILDKYRVVQIDFFPETYLFPGTNVRNIIIILQNVPPLFPVLKINHEHWDQKNYLQSIQEINDPTNVFSPFQNEIAEYKSENFATLGDICYISKGMVLNADERQYKGEFTKKDLIVNHPDTVHCKEILQGENIAEFQITGKQYLEWNTDRIPKKISRLTFLDLYVPPRLVTNKLGKLKVAYFTLTNCVCDQTVRILMKWNDLPNQAIRSLQSSLKKFSTKTLDELKQLSERFDYKYLLGVLNSSICAKIFNSLRSNSKDINPDVLRKIPIPIISQAQQTEIIQIVDQILTQPTQTALKLDLDFQIQSFFKGK